MDLEAIKFFWQTRGSQMIARWDRPILVDYFPGHGGHFLAHAINLCVFDLQPTRDIFTSLSTLRPWHCGPEYADKMQCFAAHWSHHDLSLDLDQEAWVIRLRCHNHVNQFICMVNTILRAGDQQFLGLALEPGLGKKRQAQGFWHHFVNAAEERWKPHAGSVTDISLSLLWNPIYLRRWLGHFAQGYSGKEHMALSDRLEQDHHRWLSNNHGWQIWQESARLLQDHLDDATIHAGPTVWHDLAVLFRTVSALQCKLEPDAIDRLVNTYFENDLDFQILRQQYKDHVL